MGNGPCMPYFGGNWNNGARAGVFYVNLNNPRSNSNNSLGFRSAHFQRQKVSDLWVLIQYMKNKGSISLPLRQKNILLWKQLVG